MSCTTQSPANSPPSEGAGLRRGKAAEPPGPTLGPQQHNPSPCPASDPCGNSVRQGRGAGVFPKIQGLFPTNGSRDAEQPREELLVGAALGRGGFGRSLRILRESEPAKRIRGQRGQRMDPLALLPLSTAPHHRRSLPGSERLPVTSNSFSCNS